MGRASRRVGRAAHGSRPAEGADAILQMGRVLLALQDLDAELQAGAPHPRLGTASLHASLIEGGRELSSYPDRCTLQLERRTLPGEGPGVLADEVQAHPGARWPPQDPAFEARGLDALRPSTRTKWTPAHPLPRALGVAARAAGCRADTIGMSFWTDAAVLGEAGIPSVLFGPTGAGLHGVDEWVDLASVRQCRDALAGLVRDWCR